MQTPPPYIVIFLVVTTIVIVAVLAVLLLLILLNQKRQRFFIESLATIELAHEKKILKTQTEIHEQTLKNVSREIHDNISLSLIMAKMNLYKLADEEPDETAKRNQLSFHLISEAIADLSAMSRSLNSDVIKSQGLLKALQQEIERIKRSTQLHVDVQITGEPVFLSCEKELLIFRTVQEAFNNVLKHSKAQSVWLTVKYNCNTIHLSIKDNGLGFDETHLFNDNGKASGLSSIRNRAQVFDGAMELKTNTKGTELIVTIPY